MFIPFPNCCAGNRSCCNNTENCCNNGCDPCCIVGPTGATGPMGMMGPTGPMGPMGLMGPEGPEGPMGPMGPMGLMGPEGPMGPMGPMGPEGPMGPMGPMGPEGPMGPTGPAGAGLSAVDEFIPGFPYARGAMVYYNNALYQVNRNNPSGLPGTSPDFTLVTAAGPTGATGRSEARRAGKASRSRWSPDP